MSWLSPARLERVAWLLMLLSVSDAFVYMNTSADGFSASGGGRSWISLLFLAVYCTGIGWFVVASRLQIRTATVRAGVVPFLILVLVGLSAAWSVAPMETVKQGVMLVAASLFTLCFYARMGFVGSVRIATQVVIILVLCSAIAAFLFPELSISYENHAGSWKGVFAHKNTFGAVSAIGAVMLVALRSTHQVSARFGAVGGLALLVGVFMSGSMTAFLVGALGCAMALVWSIRNYRKRHRWALLFALMALAFTAAASMVDVDVLAEAFGRDASATGRVPLWRATWAMILDHPLLGYGYAGYWQGMEERQGLVAMTSGFFSTHPHNGYLELALDFGLPFAAFMILALAALVLASGRREPSSTGRSILISVVCFMLAFNVTETSVLSSHGVFWFVFNLCLMRMGEQCFGRRHEALRA